MGFGRVQYAICETGYGLSLVQNLVAISASWVEGSEEAGHGGLCLSHGDHSVHCSHRALRSTG